jgi:predicted negative regulator of RcsB-dependent stress response
MMAHYYMGVNAADAGNLQEAEKQMKIVADSGKEPYTSQAKLSLAQVYASTGRQADAEKLLRSLIDNPSVLVSKEQATIALARVLSKDKPEEARKLLEPLRGERGPISRAALSVLGELPQR